jgi:hypothetical protein
MAHHRETRGAEHTRASEIVAWTADNSEDTAPLLNFQVRWIVRRLGIAPERAKLLAGMAFETGEAAL